MKRPLPSFSTIKTSKCVSDRKVYKHNIIMFSMITTLGLVGLSFFRKVPMNPILLLITLMFDIVAIIVMGSILL